MRHDIEVKSAVKSFGSIKAIDGLSFASTPGVNIILGPNGAGKSTLLRCIDGLYRLDRGSVRVEGADPYRDDGLKNGMSYLSDNYALYDHLNVRNNMRFFGRLYGLDDAETDRRTRRILKELNATEYMNFKVDELSRGTKQKMALCRALLNDPKILLLDEPTAFLDSNASESIRKLLHQFSDEKRTIILVTQKLDEVTRFNCRVSVIRKGRIIKDSTTSGLYGTILRDSFVNIRLARPIAREIAKRAPGFRSMNSNPATVIRVKINSYRDINAAAQYLIDKGAFIVSIDYIEPLIESLSW